MIYFYFIIYLFILFIIYKYGGGGGGGSTHLECIQYLVPYIDISAADGIPAFQTSFLVQSSCEIHERRNVPSRY